ncbi:MAG: hypothetical protein IKP05_04465 [Alphaproteobacteria bacterium]|nr:hypothetical protein [Alphaproteobacteria bacterium]
MHKPLFLLMALVACPAFAVDGVVPSRVIPTGAAQSTESATSTTSSQGTGTRNSTRTAVQSQTSIKRIIPTETTETVAEKAKSETVVARSGLGTSVTARGGLELNTRKSDINSDPSVRRAGLVLRPSVAEYGGRAIIAGTNQQTGSNIDIDIRKVTGRAAAKTPTKESIAEAKEILEQTAELNSSCQDQYNECMDQFCAVIDNNQKRCSCSANLSRYKKVEDAVNEANAKLNEVAQNIRYIGLSADEIRAIMNATEAEEALSGSTDTTENRNMLEQIEKMIKDPTTLTASYSSGDFGLDMDLDFSSEVDLFNLDFLTTNTSSLSNLRGAELYNAAKSRCKTVLNQCKKAGSTIQQVSGNYDLAIDKDCIAYEKGLEKLNETLVSNVRSAERMLQKARLAVLQNKNQYDAKGCIAALETCMTDEMVCGADYAKCVDPTKKYIDENGKVVLGQDISKILEFMTNYDTTAITGDFLESSYKTTAIGPSCAAQTSTEGGTTTSSGGDGACTVKYLLQKIGTKQKVTDEGLCRAVLDKCQAYSYTEGTYKPWNDIVVNYVQRAMINIRASQHKIISDYASSCMVDVASCYNQQVSQVNSWSSAASADSVMNVMSGACHNVALTCAYAIFPNGIESTSDGGQHVTPYKDEKTLIGAVSKMFYQSLICPDNSTFVSVGHQISPNKSKREDGPADGYVNAACRCNSGYFVWNGTCVENCDANATPNTYGVCECDGGFTGNGYTCVPNTSSGT